MKLAGHARLRAAATALGCLLTLWLPPAQAQRAPACPPGPVPLSAQEKAQAAAQAPDRGFLWRIRKGGHSSYLFGTLHLGQRDWVLPGPHLRQALAETDVLALEMDISDPATQRGIAQALGALPPMPLDAATKQRLAQQMVESCTPPEMAARLHPVLQVMTLTMAIARWQDLHVEFGQDLALAQHAHRIGRPVVALEEPAEQMRSLVPRQQKTLRSGLKSSLEQMEDGRARTVVHRLARAWAESRLEDLQGYEQWCQCATTPAERAYLRGVNDERNTHLAHGVDTLHLQGRRVLAAVGSLHMVGTQALPRLMAQRGYEVELVWPRP